MELEPEVFVTLMKIVAVICIIAMFLSVWPGEDD